tara:strand:+ start:48 stop:902 length:855 start_codon:yes stop_codon:yes gene_type:complete
MLRSDNGRALDFSDKIIYAKTGKKCTESGGKPKAHSGLSDLEKMNNFHRANSCATYSCVPLKPCMAKIGMHDSHGNWLTKEFIGKNMTKDLRTGGNQIGYVYQEKSILDSDALMNALRNGKISHNVATKIAQHNSELYGKDTSWDGQASGYFCVKCPPKPKPCVAYPGKNKKADPFNAPIGLGSNVAEASASLQENRLASVFQQREATPTKADTRTVTTSTSEEMDADLAAAGAGAVAGVDSAAGAGARRTASGQIDRRTKEGRARQAPRAQTVTKRGRDLDAF